MNSEVLQHQARVLLKIKIFIPAQVLSNKKCKCVSMCIIRIRLMLQIHLVFCAGMWCVFFVLEYIVEGESVKYK